MTSEPKLQSEAAEAQRPDRDAVASALRDTMSPAALGPERTAFAVALMRELAKGEPVTMERASTVASVELDWAKQALDAFTRMGFAEVDQHQRVLGIVLSLAPTRHGFRTEQRQLYTWCAIDTLFMPAVLGGSADVSSQCPVSHAKINLTVGVDRILDAGEGVHVSIVAPGLTPGVAASCTGALAGRDGSFCRQVHFLSSKAAADSWEAAHPGSRSLDLDEAFELAREVWAQPFVEAARQRNWS